MAFLTNLDLNFVEQIGSTKCPSFWDPRSPFCRGNRQGDYKTLLNKQADHTVPRARRQLANKIHCFGLATQLWLLDNFAITTKRQSLSIVAILCSAAVFHSPKRKNPRCLQRCIDLILQLHCQESST